MKLILPVYILFETLCFTILYYALVQNNTIAEIIVQLAIGCSLFVICSLFVLLKRNQIPITSLYRPTNVIVAWGLFRDLVVSYIFFVFGWTYCAIAIIIITVINILVVKHIDNINKPN